MRRTATRLGPRLDRRFPALRRQLTEGLTVFVYHEVTATPSEFQRLTQGYTTPDELRGHIAWISSRFELVAPTDLHQLGGSGRLPERAALITFDDAWAGTFRTGLPILAALGIPALCFVNMATVQGDPDLSAVRAYERLHAISRRLLQPIDSAQAPELLSEVTTRYSHDPSFARFQGATATVEDLERVPDRVWFGSHLFHHWDMSRIGPELFASSAAANQTALSSYANALPALATPYGLPLAPPFSLPDELGIRLVFVATGRQNRDARGPVLDRLLVEPQADPAQWWWSTHRKRLTGAAAG
jgi:peptidoglycan/xylan/chitin deacetylase (PgdA/CDA1 family)